MPPLPLPPGPSRSFPLLDLPRFRRDAIGYLRKIAAEYGDVARFSLGGQPLVLVNRPDLIHQIFVTDHRSYHKSRGLERAKRLLGEGLLTSEGERHLQHRRMLQPAFHRQRVEQYGGVMAESALRAAQSWREGEIVDITTALPHLTLAIVGRTLFDADVEAEAPEIGAALTEAIELFNFLTLPFAEKLEKLPLPQVRRFRKAKSRLDDTVYRLIAARREEGTDHGDFLSMVLAARDEDDPGKRLNDEEVRDQVMTIFLAGHETTATALIWTLYLLALNPEAERALVRELDETLKERPAGVEDLERLPWTRAVLSESMRLYPPAWMIGRKAIVDTEIGGYAIPPDTIVLMCPAVTHRDARYFDAPERFEPERWLSADAERPKAAYFPFGGGPRICIGERFAWMEMMIVLATLVREWRFSLVPGQTIGVKPILTQRPSGPIRMRLEKRNSRLGAACRENTTVGDRA